jgi:hypothetical protein
MKYVLMTVLIGLSIQLFGQTAFERKTGGHSYTMEIPDYMQRVFDLNEVATLQYLSEDPEAYMVVIEDRKEELDYFGLSFEGPEDFLKNFTDTYNVNAENRKLEEVINFHGNGNKFSQVKMTWTIEEVDYLMLITSVETNTHFYKILAWTSLANRDALLDDFIRMSSSIRD